MRIVLAPEAQRDVLALPLTMRARFDAVITQLESWPDVSGAKALRRDCIAHRSTVYED